MRTTPSLVSSGITAVNNVYFGTKSSAKQKISICDNVIIGMNSGVVKDINESGTYIGTPCKKIK
jgi:UDP-3-O-[3-hydroxymyristoyl] glucosamine N-acyltransferase